MKKTILLAVVLLTITILSDAVRSQVASGNTFTLEKVVVSNGGGTSAGTTFSVEGTSGQSAAGQGAGSVYRIQGGFWNTNLAPTAAGVSVAGRVTTPEGGGLRNAIVYLTDAAGQTLSTRTGTFGNFRFEGIQAGQTIIIGVSSKLFQFEPRVLTLNDSLADIDFTPLEKAETVKSPGN